MPPLVATLGARAPGAVIRGNGFTPVAVTPTTDRPATQGVCAVALGMAETLRRDAPLYAGAVMTTRCDQLRRALEPRTDARGVPVFVMNLPTTQGTPAAEQQERDERTRLEEHLAVWSRTCRDGVEYGAQAPEPACRAEQSPAVVGAVRSDAPAAHGWRARVGLLSCTLTAADRLVLKMIESLGLDIAVDASDAALPPDGPSLAQRPNAAFFAWLAVASGKAQLDGWVLLCQPWCDLYRAEAHRLRDAIPLPWLVLETGASPALAALRTRAEAFIEILRFRPGPDGARPSDAAEKRLCGTNLDRGGTMPVSSAARNKPSTKVPLRALSATLQPVAFADWRTRSTSCGALGRHHAKGDTRLASLRFDASPAADRLWELLLSEEERLAAARRDGLKLVGTMKDLGTVPVMAYALPTLRAFYPDGAWWTPCLMQDGDGLFSLADSLGVDASFCPVRAMLGAFVAGNRFPIPDLLTCSVGAVCDDFSAIAQRVEALGHPILWWEVPYRRLPGEHEPFVLLEDGVAAPESQVAIVGMELERIRAALADLAGVPLTDDLLSQGIRRANRVRALLRALRTAVFTAPRAPLPALELLVAEMLILHFCSDRDATEAILADLVELVATRVAERAGYGKEDDVRVFWVNPVADLGAMHTLEDCGARLCGTDFLFTHALDPISESLSPIEALARSALADPMTGPSSQRAERIIADMRQYGAEALIVSRIPGASHCAHEGARIVERVAGALAVPCIEIEVPSQSDAFASALRTRVEALAETARALRQSARPAAGGGKPAVTAFGT